MNRRSFISALGGSVILAGCSATGDRGEGDRSTTSETESPFVATDPTVEQGETAIIEISAASTERVSFSNSGIASDDEDGLEIQYDNAEFSPSPNVYLFSDPPKWDWESPQNIEGEVPVRTSSDTPPGTYQATVVFTSSDFDEAQSRQTTITVKSDSDG
ncbi:hypothetical protein [Halomicrobium salinisoli]|uniref:hypothetical protein n=1 Tax=Halomicrobium salinisoli TaxID=2878391 RepID=UPI001CF0960B|nr:hypothetical protein [Halomicrobium salinisoli]